MSENNDLLASVKEALATGNVENPVQNPVLPKVDLSTPAPDAAAPAEPAAAEPAAAKEAPPAEAAPAEPAVPETPPEPNPIDLFYKALEEKKAPVAAAATDANRFELEARQRAAQIEAEAQDKAKKLLEQMFADPLKAASMLGMDPMSYVMRGVNANEGQEDVAKQDARIRAMFEEHMKKRDDVIAMQQKQLQEVAEAQKNYRLQQEKAFLQHSQNVFLSKMSDEKHAIVKNFWGPERALNEAEKLARGLHETAQKNGVPMVTVTDEQLLDHLESLATKELETARARFKAGEEALAKKPQAAAKKPLPKNGMNPALATESSKVAGGTPKDPAAMNDREFNAWMVKNLQASKK